MLLANKNVLGIGHVHVVNCVIGDSHLLRIDYLDTFSGNVPSEHLT